MQGVDREVVENYGIEIRSIIPYKDTYILNTSKGRKVLKKMAFSSERILFVHGAKEHLIKSDFGNIDRYLCTYSGEPYFVFNNSNYILTDFIEGHECSFDNDGDVQEAALLLASMHKASRGYIPDNRCKVQDDLGKLPGYFNKRLEDIKKLKKQAKRGKSGFDHLFLEYVDYFYHIGEDAAIELGKSSYETLVIRTREEGLFCHHDYAHHNIISSDDKLSITNFDYCCFELKLYDMANFIRRKMRKSNWDIDKAIMIIENYCSIEHISKEEFMVMKSILQFPQKFWRVVNRYYNSRRSWSERSFVSKLNEVISEVEYHKKFLERYDRLM